MDYFNDTVAYLEDGDFDESNNLKVTKLPAIVMLQGNFCGYCKLAKPAFYNVAKSRSDVFWGTIQLDGPEKESTLAKKLTSSIPNYRGVPTYLLYVNGKFVGTHDSGRDEKSLNEVATKLLSNKS